MEFQQQSQLELEKLFSVFAKGEYLPLKWKSFYQKYQNRKAIQNALIAGLNPMKLFWEYSMGLERQSGIDQSEARKAHERIMRIKRQKCLKMIGELLEQRPSCKWEEIEKELELGQEEQQEAKKVYVLSLQMEEGELSDSESKRCKINGNVCE